MAKAPPGAETTVVPILRQDGTVYFRYPGRMINERMRDWALAFLWFLVIAVTAVTLLWS